MRASLLSAALALLSIMEASECVRAFAPPTAPPLVAFGRPSSSASFQRRAPPSSTASTSATSVSALHASRDLNALASELNAAIDACTPTYFKNMRVKVAPSPSSSDSAARRLGLVAIEDIKPNKVALSVPYDDQIVLSASLAGDVWGDVLPEGYDGWTGERGLIALLVLNELAKASGGGGAAGGAGIDLPARKPEAKNLMAAWVKSLPSPEEMSEDGGGGGVCPHPLLWSEDDQELLQGSSTKKIYRTLDDIDEDSAWLNERVWSAADRTAKFPPEITLDGGETTRACFSPEGFRWANAIVSSRAVYVDGALRLIPVLDMINHDDLNTEEVRGGYAGAFGTTPCAELRTSSRKYIAGEEVCASYGPLSAAEYLSDYGFIPSRAESIAVSELTFEVSSDDRFYDDKLDVLEFETYDSSPMDPTQKFDIVHRAGQPDTVPDPALMQFLRLSKLDGKDAFLLESIFRKEVWGFMSVPVSEMNEGMAVDAVMEACRVALGEMDETEESAISSSSSSGDGDDDDSASTSPAALCAVVRRAERKALTRTLEYMERERMALDLKEYYQERRLKDLGLDSEWNDDDENSDVGWGQTRAPGSGDLDW